MTTVLALHSILRWAIVAVAIIAAVKFFVGWRRGGEFGKMDRGLAAGFSGLMDLQVLLGFVYFFWNGFAGGGFPSYRIEHLVTMLIAAAVGHLPSRWKSLDNPTRFRRALYVVLGVLAIVFVGVGRLPGGWTR
ncbi:MAG: hypothetical protein ACOYZ8_04355 [Chloroflexota bacterium]